MRSSILSKLVTVFGLALILSLLHWGVGEMVREAAGPYRSFHIFDLVGFRVSLTPGTSATPFGLDSSTVHFVSIFVSIAFALSFIVPALVIVQWRYRFQTLAVSTIAAALIVMLGEFAFVYTHLTYVSVCFENVCFPTFGIPGMAITFSLVFLYGFTMLRFFRLLPISTASIPAGVRGNVFDPLYEMRRPLKVMLFGWGCGLVLATVRDIVVTGLQSAPLFGQNPAIATIFVLWLEIIVINIIVLAIVLAPIILTWKLIPTRRIDVLYLRAFMADRQLWSVVRKLRKAATRAIRITGVVDPSESRRLIYLYFWLANPFMFAIGDLSRPNSFRHNIFLDGDWKAGVRAAFPSARAAIFDCRTMTPNLIWEINVGMKMIGPENLFFLMADGLAPKDLLGELREFELDEAALSSIATGNCYTASGVSALGSTLREVIKG